MLIVLVLHCCMSNYQIFIYFTVLLGQTLSSAWLGSQSLKAEIKRSAGTVCSSGAQGPLPDSFGFSRTLSLIAVGQKSLYSCWLSAQRPLLPPRDSLSSGSCHIAPSMGLHIFMFQISDPVSLRGSPDYVRPTQDNLPFD